MPRSAAVGLVAMGASWPEGYTDGCGWQLERGRRRAKALQGVQNWRVRLWGASPKATGLGLFARPQAATLWRPGPTQPPLVSDPRRGWGIPEKVHSVRCQAATSGPGRGGPPVAAKFVCRHPGLYASSSAPPPGCPQPNPQLLRKPVPQTESPPERGPELTDRVPTHPVNPSARSRRPASAHRLRREAQRGRPARRAPPRLD